MTTTMVKSNDALIRAGVFTKEASEAIAIRSGEPDWLVAKRRAAWSVFEETPMPSLSDEPWRRTSLKRIKWNKFSLDTPSSIAQASKLADLPENIRTMFDADRDAAGRMLIVNGQVLYHEMDADVAEKGVIFSDLQSAAKAYADLVEPHLMGECVP
ncbi:MAG: hypothetical protein AAF629_02590, partial [Chloroflexota bacterium]